jgi:hypothetical protein
MKRFVVDKVVISISRQNTAFSSIVSCTKKRGKL